MNKTKNRQWYFLLIVVVMALCIKAYSYYWPKAQVNLAGQKIDVLVADNSRHLFQGLSNRKDLGKYKGMLFVFPNDDRHTMVMRNMFFPIDIVWLHDYTVVDIAPSAQLEADNSDLKPYIPRIYADMVLELEAGFAQKNGLKIGDNVSILR